MLLTSAWIGLAAPFTCFALHILAYRLWPAAQKMQRQKLTVLVILLATLLAVVAAWLTTEAPEEIANAGIVSLLFGYTYFHWFNMSETARRIRMLVRYVAQSAAADEVYSAETILNNRLLRLAETSSIVLRDGKYILQRGPLLWATRVILFWRSLFYAN